MPQPVVYRMLKVEPHEAGALAWSCLYFFVLLAAYYLLRPVREAMATVSGVENLPWLYLATLCAMLVASLVFAAVTSRWPRRVFIPWAYRFFASNVLVFYVVLRAVPEESLVWIGRVYFVWVSVFNLFVVSVFWSFMADVFTNAQGKRLFAMIAVGGTFGQIAGSWFAGRFAARSWELEALLLSALLLEAGCWCVARLNDRSRDASEPGAPEAGGPALGGRAWDGLVDVARSGYLLGIAGFMFLYTTTSTFLYGVKVTIASDRFEEIEHRVHFFARIDLWTGVATVVAQLLITGRLMGRFGVGVTLGVLPVVTMLGFLVLAAGFASPAAIDVAAVIIVFEAVRRASNYAVSRPAREVLYTVVPREEKYKAKNAIDTFVYRAGDQLGIVAFTGLLRPLGAAATCAITVPLALLWLLVALRLGAAQRRRAQPAKLASMAASPG